MRIEVRGFFLLVFELTKESSEIYILRWWVREKDRKETFYFVAKVNRLSERHIKLRLEFWSLQFPTSSNETES